MTHQQLASKLESVKKIHSKKDNTYFLQEFYYNGVPMTRKKEDQKSEAPSTASYNSGDKPKRGFESPEFFNRFEMVPDDLRIKKDRHFQASLSQGSSEDRSKSPKAMRDDFEYQSPTKAEQIFADTVSCNSNKSEDDSPSKQSPDKKKLVSKQMKQNSFMSKEEFERRDAERRRVSDQVDQRIKEILVSIQETKKQTAITLVRAQDTQDAY